MLVWIAIITNQTYRKRPFMRWYDLQNWTTMSMQQQKSMCFIWFSLQIQMIPSRSPAKRDGWDWLSFEGRKWVWYLRRKVLKKLPIHFWEGARRRKEKERADYEIGIKDHQPSTSYLHRNNWCREWTLKLNLLVQNKQLHGYIAYNRMLTQTSPLLSIAESTTAKWYSSICNRYWPFRINNSTLCFFPSIL